MSAPGTAASIAAASGITVTSLLLGMDGNAVVGAFAGAVLMVVSSKDLRWPTRIAYLFISWLMGYMAAPELVKYTFIDQTGVAAFFAAAVVVSLTLSLIDRVRQIDFLAWLKRGGT